jgi:hypothetical protein
MLCQNSSAAQVKCLLGCVVLLALLLPSQLVAQSDLRQFRQSRQPTAPDSRMRFARAPGIDHRRPRADRWSFSRGQPNRSRGQRGEVALEVKQLGKDFTKWGLSKTLNDPSELLLTFRWATALSGVASAKYEISQLPFTQTQVYEPPFSLVAANVVTSVPVSGKSAAFSIDFAPIVQAVLGSAQAPNAPALFFVRLVARDAQNTAIGAPSNQVKIVYRKPAGETTEFDSVRVSLSAVKCLDETDGEWGSSDEIRVLFFVADLSTHPAGTNCSATGILEDMDAGETVHPDTTVWNYSGPGYYQDHVIILVAMLENDDEFVGNPFKGLGSKVHAFQTWNLLPPAICNLLIQHAKIALHLNASNSGEDCIGSVQQLRLTSNDWYKVTSGSGTVLKKLSFSGDGGKYQLSFLVSKS